MSLPPVVKTIRVDLPPQDAFTLFTARLAEWWPMDRHSVSANAGHASKTVEMGEGVGAELVEIGHDGTRHVWGQIEEWAPGTALAMTWHPGRTDGVETRVRVTFEAEGGGTLLTLTHSDWEKLGETAEVTRGGYDQGWVGVLAAFSEVV